MKKLTVFTLLLLFSFSAWSGGGETSPSNRLQDLLSPYKNSKGLQSAIVKEFYTSFSDKTETSKGTVSLYKGRMKIRIESPKESKSLLVLNSKGLWLETPFDEGFPPAVTKLPSKSFTKSEGVWGVVVSDLLPMTAFKIKREIDGEVQKYLLKPAGKESYELSKALISFKSNKLWKLSYWDQMDNRVTYEFLKWSEKKFLMDEFEYKPPKGATVTEL